jgi:hypothetical protein
MKQKGIGLAAVFVTTILTAVFTTTPPFSMKDAEGQSFPPCPVGYELNPFDTCVPIAEQPPSEIRIGQNTVCSGWSFTCG